jgi:hypothetical protein
MAQFILPQDNKIKGSQLIDEILKATGIDLTDKYAFYPPDTVQVHDSFVAGHEAEIQAIVEAHEPDPLYFHADRERAVENNALTQASNIPGWTSWTEEQTTDWIDDNVVDLASAKTALRAMARMMIALRNKVFPNLQK